MSLAVKFIWQSGHPLCLAVLATVAGGKKVLGEGTLKINVLVQKSHNYPFCW